MSDVGIKNAAKVLDVLANGGVPDRVELLSGALSLDTLLTSADCVVTRDLLDAAEGLRQLATDQEINWDETGRARAAYLAQVVRTLTARN